MNITAIIEKYEGKILSYGEFVVLGFDECVEYIKYNGRSGIDNSLDWHTVCFVDGREIDVYIDCFN